MLYAFEERIIIHMDKVRGDLRRDGCSGTAKK